MTTAIIGYARTSTAEQVAGLEAQLKELNAAGCTKIFQEQVSSVDTQRPELERALEYVREGDMLVVTKLDRLARSMSNLVEISKGLKDKGVAFKVLNAPIDTSSPTGELILNLLGSIAEFERKLMLERQREGIAKAKADGKYQGRAPTAQRKAGDVFKLKAEGKSVPQIVEALGISRASVFRILKEEA